MNKQVAIYEETLDDEGAIIGQERIAVVPDVEHLRFAFDPSTEDVAALGISESWETEEVVDQA